MPSQPLPADEPAKSHDSGSLSGEGDVAPRKLSQHPVDEPRIARAVREILAAVGEDPDREGLLETPARVARMYTELFAGLHEDPRTHLRKFFSEQYDEVVLVRDISFNSVCEHHMLPFFGKCHIGYIPKGKILGVSKLARLVDMFARRLQIQERLSRQIAHGISDAIAPEGVGVVIEAQHLCMLMRGVEKQESFMTTSAMLGSFRREQPTRMEFLKLIKG